MKNTKRSFFYFPTWTLFLICISFLGMTMLELFLIFNTNLFENIGINGVEYAKGTEEYAWGINTMKQVFGISALVTFLTSVTSGWFGYKRIKNKKI